MIAVIVLSAFSDAVSYQINFLTSCPPLVYAFLATCGPYLRHIKFHPFANFRKKSSLKTYAGRKKSEAISSTSNFLDSSDWSQSVDQLYQKNKMKAFMKSTDAMKQFEQIAERKVCPELLLFMDAFESLSIAEADQVTGEDLLELHRIFTMKNAPYELNLTDAVRVKLLKKVLEGNLALLDFQPAYEEVQQSVFQNLYMDFIHMNHKHYRQSTGKWDGEASALKATARLK